jgi:hypothetical protein
MSLLRAALCLLVPGALASAQPFGVGIKVGVPVTDAFSVLQNPSQTLTETHHYTAGGYGELRLPAGLALEIDALYRTYEVQGSSASAWEFPVLVKHRILPGPIKPYFDAGLSFSHLSDINVSSLQHLANFGVVVGGGVELKVFSMRMGPEVRYTGWWFHNFDGQVQTNRNQLEVLFGVGF